MNRSTGTPRPRSWKETKLTTYPAGGLGSGSPNGAIHSGLSGSVIGRRRPSSTRDYSISTDTSDGSQGSASMITMSPAMSVVEGSTTAVSLPPSLSFSLSLALSLSRSSPFFSSALSVLGNGQATESKEGRGEPRFVFMQGKDETDRRRNRGSFPRVQARLIQIRFYRMVHVRIFQFLTKCILLPRYF